MPGYTACNLAPYHHSNCECCFRAMYRSGTFHVTMLRSPRAHILSQYLYSANSTWGQRNSKAFAKMHPSAMKMPAIGANGEWREPYRKWLRLRGDGTAMIEWTPAVGDYLTRTIQ